MSKYNKILIKILISFIFIISTIILYGLIIGGYTNILFYLIIGIITGLSVLFVFGKSFFKKAHIPLIILLICVLCLFSGDVYTFINDNFDDNVTNSYMSEIVDGPGSAQAELNYYFSDPNGTEKCYTKKYLIFEPVKFEIGDSVYVEEYKGVFGIEHYSLSKINQ